MSDRYRVDWHPHGAGKYLAVFDAMTGLVVAGSDSIERPALTELVRLANIGQWAEAAATGTTPDATDDGE